MGYALDGLKDAVEAALAAFSGTAPVTTTSATASTVRTTSKKNDFNADGNSGIRLSMLFADSYMIIDEP